MNNRKIPVIIAVILVIAALGAGFIWGKSLGKKNGAPENISDSTSVGEAGGKDDLTPSPTPVGWAFTPSRESAADEDATPVPTREASDASDDDAQSPDQSSAEGTDGQEDTAETADTVGDISDRETAADDTGDTAGTALDQETAAGKTGDTVSTTPDHNTAGGDGAGEAAAEGTTSEGTAGDGDGSGSGLAETVAGEATSVSHEGTAPTPAPGREAEGDREADAGKNQGENEPIAAPGKTDGLKTTATPVPTKAPAKAEKGTPLANHGKLTVKGSNLTDKNGKKYLLKGVSTHGLAWFPGYVNKASFTTLRDEWGASCVRLAMYTAEYGGYCSGGDKDALKKLVENGVDYATDLGMYVIIDWHILSDTDPNTNKAEAKKFFAEMSKKYADHDNVLYEICNEPNGGTKWADIKKYAQEIIPVIRANAPDSVIIVGTPTWSQEVDKPAADPITGYDNIMYTIHFYAGTHKDDLRKRMKNAVDSGIAVFCTEFGTCDASGNGSNAFDEADKWIAAMEECNVSYCIWNLSNKSETSALISSSCSKTSGWKESELSDSGKWYVKTLGGKASGSSGDNSGTGSGKENSGGKTGNDGGNGNNGQGDQKDDSSKQKPVTGSKDTVSAALTQSGSWNDGSYNYYQYTLTIKNTANTAVSGWKITVSFGFEISIDQGWSGTFSAKGKKITVTPADYNKELASGSSTEVGFIVKSAKELGSASVTVE